MPLLDRHFTRVSYLWMSQCQYVSVPLQIIIGPSFLLFIIWINDNNRCFLNVLFSKNNAKSGIASQQDVLVLIKETIDWTDSIVLIFYFIFLKKRKISKISYFVCVKSWLERSYCLVFRLSWKQFVIFHALTNTLPKIQCYILHCWVNLLSMCGPLKEHLSPK